jgi:hypothetical protein
LVDEGGELWLVGCVEEEVAEAIVRVHDLDLGDVVVPVEGEGMEDDVGVDGVCSAGAGEVAGLDVGSKTLFGCFGGDGDLHLSVFCRQLRRTVGQVVPGRNGETHLPISWRMCPPSGPSCYSQERCRPGIKLRWRAGQLASRLCLHHTGFGRLRFLQ